MANLTHAPIDKLSTARAAYANFKKLATAKGIHYCRVYTSYNTRTQQVRVKVYAVGAVQAHLPKVNKLGFELERGKFGGYSSLVAHF